MTPQSLPHSKAEPPVWGGVSHHRQPSRPFVVSLSRIIKDPTTFAEPRSCRSASFRLMPLKNHLQQKQMNQRTLMGLGELRLAWGRAGGRTWGRSGDSCGGGVQDCVGPG